VQTWADCRAAQQRIGLGRRTKRYRKMRHAYHPAPCLTVAVRIRRSDSKARGSRKQALKRVKHGFKEI
jgi:hypothetical protein